MKKILLAVFLLSACTSYAQDTSMTKFSKPASAESLMAKSRRQNTTGWILIGSGLLLQGSGVITGFFSAVEDLTGSNGTSKLNRAKVLFYTGTAAVATGIGFVIASATTKRKAKLAMGAGQLWLTPQAPLGPAYATVKLTVYL